MLTEYSCHHHLVYHPFCRALCLRENFTVAVRLLCLWLPASHLGQLKGIQMQERGSLLTQPKCPYILPVLFIPAVVPGNGLGKDTDWCCLVRGTVFLPTSPAASVRKCLRTCHSCGAVLEGLEVCLVTALLLPFVNMTGKAKSFLGFYHCSWFTVLLPYKQNRFLRQCQQLSILGQTLLGPVQHL